MMIMEAFDFGEALKRVKAGKRCKRIHWNGQDQFIELAVNVSYKNPKGEIVNGDHVSMGNAAIAFHGTHGVQIGWLASQADMLSDDWCEVE